MKKIILLTFIILISIILISCADSILQNVPTDDIEMQIAETGEIPPVVLTPTPEPAPTPTLPQDTPVPTASPKPTPIVEHDYKMLEVAGAMMTNPQILNMGNASSIRTTEGRIIDADAEYYIKMSPDFPKIFISENSSCREWVGNQGTIMKFRINEPAGCTFKLSGNPYGGIEEIEIDFSMEMPGYPMVGMRNSKMEYVGFEYPTAFSFIQGEWYFLLAATDKDSEICFAVWQEDNPQNMAYYRSNVSEYMQRDDYNIVGNLCMMVVCESEREFHDIDFANYYEIGFKEFIYGR